MNSPPVTSPPGSWVKSPSMRTVPLSFMTWHSVSNWYSNSSPYVEPSTNGRQCHGCGSDPSSIFRGAPPHPPTFIRVGWGGSPLEYVAYRTVSLSMKENLGRRIENIRRTTRATRATDRPHLNECDAGGL